MEPHCFISASSFEFIFHPKGQLKFEIISNALLLTKLSHSTPHAKKVRGPFCPERRKNKEEHFYEQKGSKQNTHPVICLPHLFGVLFRFFKTSGRAKSRRERKELDRFLSQSKIGEQKHFRGSKECGNTYLCQKGKKRRKSL